jgi:hypothetical protein
MLVFAPVLLQRLQAAFLRGHGSFQFLIEPVGPGFVVARQGHGLLPAHLGDMLEAAFHLVKQPAALFALICHEICILQSRLYQ